MPSPVGHALGGLIVGLLVAPRTVAPAHPRTVGTFSTLSTSSTLWTLALIACLPDLDFLWGRHGAETHSLGAALVAAAVAALWTRGRRPWLVLAVGLAWVSHPVFDWLGSDDTPPLGVMGLWPFSDQYYFADAYVFDAISRRYWLPGFLSHNLRAMVREVLLLAPVALGVGWLRFRMVLRGSERF